jgi:hypothetical protein
MNSVKTGGADRDAANIIHAPDRDLYAYDGLEDSAYPECSAARVTHTVKFANGTVLKLCEQHTRWYREIHPIKIPITPKAGP